ncbi:hypothetical protein BZA77DRAFT_354738 [Pyronema omphalodes]|nr:hypothetical protein BZA77DRAFT_354738 [Pyronema omphalodes]
MNTPLTVLSTPAPTPPPLPAPLPPYRRPHPSSSQPRPSFSRRLPSLPPNTTYQQPPPRSRQSSSYHPGNPRSPGSPQIPQNTSNANPLISYHPGLPQKQNTKPVPAPQLFLRSATRQDIPACLSFPGDMRAYILGELETILEDTSKRLVVVELESVQIDEVTELEKREKKVVAFAV